MKKIKVLFIIFLVLLFSGCSSNVEENLAGKIYKGCDYDYCYTYVFNEDHTGIKDDDQNFVYKIDGNEVTLYSNRWSNSPVRYKYNNKTKCLERLDGTRTLCQTK